MNVDDIVTVGEALATIAGAVLKILPILVALAG